MLYHVSGTQGIQVLEPRESTHKKPYVYAIENLVTGLLFGVKHDDFDFRISTDKSGKPQLYECYPQAFEIIYSGKSCSVYEVSEEGFLWGMTGWSVELVNESSVPVQKETFITDLYTRLLAEEAAGNLEIHRFSEAPEYKKMIAEHIVDRLIRFDAVDYMAENPRGRKYFKDLIQGLKSVMDGHLL